MSNSAPAPGAPPPASRRGSTDSTGNPDRAPQVSRPAERGRSPSRPDSKHESQRERTPSQGRREDSRERRPYSQPSGTQSPRPGRDQPNYANRGPSSNGKGKGQSSNGGKGKGQGKGANDKGGKGRKGPNFCLACHEAGKDPNHLYYYCKIWQKAMDDRWAVGTNSPAPRASSSASAPTPPTPQQ